MRDALDTWWKKADQKASVDYGLHMIVTDLAVFARPDHASPFHLVECAPGVTAEDVAAKTTAHYIG